MGRGPRRGQGGHRTMAASLQRGAAPFESRISDADGIQGERRGQPHRGIERTTHAHGASDGRRSPVITGPKNPGRSAGSLAAHPNAHQPYTPLRMTWPDILSLPWQVLAWVLSKPAKWLGITSDPRLTFGDPFD